MQELEPDAVIRGNHDKAACGIDDGSQFNHVARMAAIWTGEQLTPENRDYLRALPMGPVADRRAHRDLPRHAVRRGPLRLRRQRRAPWRCDAAARPLCLYGHTHLPAIFRIVDRDMASFEGSAPDPDREVVVPLQRGAQYLINAGSIGQPRDGDPRAGYGVLDDEAREVRLYRVPYPVEERAAEDHRRRAAGESREPTGAGALGRSSTRRRLITKVTKARRHKTSSSSCLCVFVPS